MFLEVTREVYDKKLKKMLEDEGVDFVEVDVLNELMANVPQSKKPASVSYVHLQFPSLTPETKKENRKVADMVDLCYGIVAKESKKRPEANRPRAYEEKESTLVQSGIEIH